MSRYESNFPHGIMFHHIHDETHPPGGQGSISADQFEAILNFVGIENILNPEEWIYKLLEGKLKKNDFCLTFDDALKCQYDVCIPILDKYGIKCFWFVYSSVFEGKVEKVEIYRHFAARYFENIDNFYKLFFAKFKESKSDVIDKRKLDKFVHRRKKIFPFYTYNDLKYRFIRDEHLNQINYENILNAIIKESKVNIEEFSKNLWMTDSHLEKLCKNGHFIGLHSYTHPTKLSRLSPKEQLEEYKRNYQHLKKVCNGEIVAVSHPCNSYNTNTLKILRRMGILCGFRSNMSAPQGKDINPTFLEMAREDHANILAMMGK